VVRPGKGVGRCGEIKDRQRRSQELKERTPSQRIPIIDQSIKVQKESSIENQEAKEAHNRTRRTLFSDPRGSLARREKPGAEPEGVSGGESPGNKRLTDNYLILYWGHHTINNCVREIGRLVRHTWGKVGSKRVVIGQSAKPVCLATDRHLSPVNRNLSKSPIIFLHPLCLLSE